MRLSLLFALAFFSAQIHHAQAANDHWKVAQASSRTGGYDLYPGGGSPGGVAIPGEIYHPYNEHSGGSNVGGEYLAGYGNPGGSSVGGSSVGGSNPGGSNPGGSGP
jgi:hypothetical protein